jgi:hypothetical protein
MIATHGSTYFTLPPRRKTEAREFVATEERLTDELAIGDISGVKQLSSSSLRTLISGIQSTSFEKMGYDSTVSWLWSPFSRKIFIPRFIPDGRRSATGTYEESLEIIIGDPSMTIFLSGLTTATVCRLRSVEFEWNFEYGFYDITEGCGWES